MKSLTAIAISGGIDSLVSAYLLKKKGHNLMGIHFYTGYGTNGTDLIMRIADMLGIYVKILDCASSFKSEVTNYFIKTYLSGITPNPCMQCNPKIKFGTVLSFAKKNGATQLATGHYARTRKDDFGNYHLLRGIDKKKDQSYFLARLSQEQLSFACFPLGHMTKEEVKKLAVQKKFLPFIKDETQDICFVGSKTYGEFIAEHTDYKSETGIIEDIHGNIIGKHNGLHLFTVGQRRGINCPASESYYVVKIDVKQNKLIVGFKKDIYSPELEVENINWINDHPLAPTRILTQIRGRHTPALSTIFPIDKQNARITFDKPQSSITPGQGAVFYRDDEVLGGGWITA